MKTNVVIKHGSNPADLAYQAIASVFKEDVKGKKILLKPNLGRVGPAKSGLCTHSEVIRGLIRFFQDQGAKEIYVGDGALVGVDVWEVFATSGIADVCRATGATCVNLDEYQEKELKIPNPVIVDKLKVSSFLEEVDLVISVPVMKTHMYTGVTLSIKNMKGCLFRKEKTKLHRIFKEPPDKTKGLTLDYGIADMAAVLLPNYVVIDGVIGMEGFGPSVGTPKALNVVIASQNPLAADLIAVRLMGMEWSSIPHLNLIKEKLKLSEDGIQVEPDDYMQYAKQFASASLDQLNSDYPNIQLVEAGACSACSAAVMSFIKNYGAKLPPDNIFKLATGKDLEVDDWDLTNTVLIGNCTASTAKKTGLTFCQGCPPVGSSIFEYINELLK